MVDPTKPEAQRRRSARSLDDPLDPHSEIALHLRALYADAEQEPIPAALIDLLERLDAAEEHSRR